VLVKRKKQRGILIDSGKRIMATFRELVISRNVKVNGRYTQILICEYKDEKTNTVYRFKSESVWLNIPQIDYDNKPLVPVYVDHDDYSKYYIAVDEFVSSITGDANVIDFT
jgi:hypothetical protein